MEGIAYGLILFGGLIVIAGVTGAGEWLERRSGRFSRFLDRWVGRPDGWE